MTDFGHVQIQKIFITHAHYDHFGGLWDVMNVLKKRGQQVEPQVYKKLDGNKFEKEVFARYPELGGKVFDLKHD
jgi:ribonuclease BN (tRNA processing enzyme)